MFLLASVLGLSYGSAHLGERDRYILFYGKEVTLEGRVKEDPTRAPSGRVSLQLDEVKLEGANFAGTVLVSVAKAGEVKRGDRAQTRGVLGESFGSFPATMKVLSLRGLRRPVPGDVGRVVRDWFGEQVRQVVSEPQASLGMGFLTGQKNALPEDLAEALKIAGLTHIVVASGYNLTILVRMARRLFARFSKYGSTIAAAVMIVSFVGITGMSPSMTRAGLVSALSLLAWYYGRVFHPLVLLPFAAAITVMLQPSYVWGDLGWQLSFAAFAGVMILSPLLQRYFFGAKEPGIIRQVAGETLSAHIVTVPIIALGFGVISNVAIVANMLVVPLVPLAMLLTFACGVLAAAQLPFLAELVAYPTTWLLRYMVEVATYVSELSWAQVGVVLPWWGWCLYLVGLCGACVWMWRATRFDFRASNPII